MSGRPKRETPRCSDDYTVTILRPCASVGSSSFVTHQSAFVIVRRLAPETARLPTTYARHSLSTPTDRPIRGLQAIALGVHPRSSMASVDPYNGRRFFARVIPR